MSACCIERAIALLFHARNSHGAMRTETRRLIHHDIALLRKARGISACE